MYNNLYSYYYSSLDTLYELQKSFIIDLNARDNRDSIVKDFMTKYHLFIDEFKEIMAYPETREEIVKLLDDLMEQVWACIETKKDLLREKREEIIIQNDIGQSFTKFTEYFEKSVVVEYNKAERLLRALMLSHVHYTGDEIDVVSQ